MHLVMYDWKRKLSNLFHFGFFFEIVEFLTEKIFCFFPEYAIDNGGFMKFSGKAYRLRSS
jgi:hypothetical protein